MSKFRLVLLGTAAAGMFGSVVSPVFAGEVVKTMAVSGHINRAVVVSDDGKSTTVGQIDNTAVAGSRFRIDANAKSDSMTIRAYTELGVQANPSLSSQADSTTRSLNIRHSYISVANNMGTLTIGHTSTVDDGSVSSTLSGTTDAGFYDAPTIGGELMRVKGNTGTGSSGVSVVSVLPFFDGGRSTTVNYKTPTMAGFDASAGFSDSEHAAARLNYSADYDGTKVLASAAWGSRAAAAVDAEFGGSIAISLAGGLNGSIAYSRRDLNSNVAANVGLNDPEFLGASLGYTVGNNGITGWYQQAEDVGANGTKAESYALVVQHKMADYGASVYGGIQNVDYKTVTTQYDDLTAGWVGIKVTF